VDAADNTPDIEVLLFDLGGVLLDLNDPAAVFRLSSSRDEFLQTWIRSPTVRAFESGGIDVPEFATRMVEEAELPYDAAEFLVRFDRWPHRLFDGIEEMLIELAEHYELALLSNTNERHWHRPGVGESLVPLIDRIFLSFETGLLKPDDTAFRDVVERIGRSPSAIAFFDDNPANVAAATDFGFRAFLARGPGDIEASLAEIDD
jgi:HAD superfamily hydrolase (TIGR01509 family)